MYTNAKPLVDFILQSTNLSFCKIATHHNMWISVSHSKHKTPPPFISQCHHITQYTMPPVGRLQLLSTSKRIVVFCFLEFNMILALSEQFQFIYCCSHTKILILAQRYGNGLKRQKNRTKKSKKSIRITLFVWLSEGYNLRNWVNDSSKFRYNRP